MIQMRQRQEEKRDNILAFFAIVLILVLSAI
jgi:hypothetical protein